MKDEGQAFRGKRLKREVHEYPSLSQSTDKDFP
ncbi:MAG: hypothetical protein UW89_C0013G0007 [Parcubacteria group bacterium GW2011_GWB1_45_10]|nr:MAG: hypothetical protein UW89_C0013G0007 [Parcubacteria group bacterium GW2011_GWB1_45_10]